MLAACDSFLLFHGTVVTAPGGEQGEIRVNDLDQVLIGAPVRDATVEIIWRSGPACDKTHDRESATFILETDADGTFDLERAVEPTLMKWVCLLVSKPRYESMSAMWERDASDFDTVFVSLKERIL
jgi:hypothetical protein